MTPYVQFSGTRDEAEALIRALPAVLAGQAPDVFGIARGIQLRTGVALLSEVLKDFVTKSRGGTGRDGIKWPPLKPETVARRRAGPGEIRGLGIGTGLRPSLSPAHDAVWRAVFRRNWQLLRMDVGDGAAKARAAAMAWGYVKTLGAKTKVELLGHRQVDILRDTGELMRSLTPGVEDRPSDADGQIFMVQPGRVIVGTNKKPQHHRGDPSRGLPKRLLWPEDGSIPDPWWVGINSAFVSGFQEAVVRVLIGVHA